MTRFLQAIYDVPDLIRQIFSGKYALLAVLLTIVYLIVLFLSSKVTRVIREFLVLAAVVTGVVGYFKKRFDLLWLMVILLALLAVVGLLRFLLVTIRQNRINRKIERRALEKAEMRRGSWKNKKGYSGPQRIDEGAQEPIPAMNEAEIADVVENETSEREGAAINLDAPVPEAAASASASSSAAAPASAAESSAASTAESSAPAASSDTTAASASSAPAPARTSEPLAPDSPLSRTAVMEILQKLEDLKVLGVLTESEFNEKRSSLYDRMG